MPVATQETSGSNQSSDHFHPSSSAELAFIMVVESFASAAIALE